MSAPPTLRPARPGDVTLTCADIERARASLGYDPGTTFEDGIGKFVDWYRARPGVS